MAENEILPKWARHVLGWVGVLMAVVALFTTVFNPKTWTEVSWSWAARALAALLAVGVVWLAIRVALGRRRLKAENDKLAAENRALLEKLRTANGK